MSEPGTHARSWHPAVLLVLIGALSTFGPLALDLFLAGLPALAADLRTDPAIAQLSISLCLVGLALGQLAAGPLSDRVGRRGPLLVGVVCFTVSALGCAVAPRIDVLLGMRLLTGLGGGAGVVIARAMVRDLYQGQAALRAFSLVAVVSGVAPVVAPLLGAGMLTFTTWRGVFVGLAAIGMLLVLAALAIGETHPASAREPTPVPVLATMGRLLRDRGFIFPALTLGLGMCPMFAYISMGSFVLQGSAYGLSEQAYGAVFAANAVGIMLTARLNSGLAVRFGARTVLGAGIGLITVGSGLLVVATALDLPTWTVLVLLFVVVGSGGFAITNGTFLAMDRHGGTIGGSASALLGLTQFMIAAVVPPVASSFGVSGVSMAATMLGCGLAAGLVFLGIPTPADPRAGALDELRPRAPGGRAG